jgi:hypothetical protein
VGRTRFVAAPGLDGLVAHRHLAPEVARLLDAVQDQARRNAPDAQVWITARDERVRPVHRHTDGQTIPNNLRFILSEGERGNDVDDEIREAGAEYARYPRDPDLSIGNRINCRCVAVDIPGLVAQSIHSDPFPQIVGTRVRGEVWTRFHRAIDSEFGTAQDPPGRWMGSAVDAVALRSQSASARRT